MRLLAFVLIGACPAFGAAPVELTILHTNDIHGHVLPWKGWEGELQGKTVGGFDHLAWVVRKVRRERAQVLLLDAGDTISDTMLAAGKQGALLTELMNAVGYNAMTLGNHEPDFGPAVLRRRIQESRFPVVAANVMDRVAGTTLAKPYAMATAGDLRVAIVGLGYPNTPLTTAAKNVAGLEFRDAVATANEVIPRVRRNGAGLVIVLSHLGLSADRRLAETVSGIDVIVGGHSHNRMREAMRVGNALIVQAGAHLSDVGRLDLTVQDGKVIGHHRELIPLDHTTTGSDEEVAAILRGAAPPGEGQEVIARGTAAIVRAQTLAGDQPERRDRQSPADSLFADLIRGAAGAAIALLPGVGYGVAIPPGPIGESQLRNLVPHDSKVVTMTLTGAQIREILEQSVENLVAADPSQRVGGMIQVSGLRFSWSAKEPRGARVSEVKVGTEALDAGRRYRVATNSMLAAGGHNYRAFLAGVDRREEGSQFEILREALRRRREVTAPEDRRIGRIDE